MKERKNFLNECIENYQQRSFLHAYNKVFELVRADTEALKEKAFRLRYQVYCEENGFEKPPGWETRRIEIDAFDDRATHYLLMRKISDEVAGTLRVILPNDEFPGQSFPVQKKCAHPLLKSDARILKLCEVSRFCMAPRFRKRERDGRMLSSYYDQDIVQGTVNGKLTFFRRQIPYAPAALIQGAFDAALSSRVIEGIWMVDPVHLASLQRIGFAYKVLGPHVKYHGGAQPVIFNIKNVLDSMREKNPHCWDIVSDQGRLQKMADDLSQNNWQDDLMDDDAWEEAFEGA